MTIRTRLILMLSVPLLALVIVGAFGFRSQSIDAERNEEARQTADNVILVDQIGRSLGTERIFLAEPSVDPDRRAVETETDRLLNLASRSSIQSVADVGNTILDFRVEMRTTDDTALAFARYDEALEEVNEFFDDIELTGFEPDSIALLKGLQQSRIAADAQDEAWFSVLDIEVVDNTQISNAVAAFEQADAERIDAAAAEAGDGQRPFEGPTSSRTSATLTGLEAIVRRDLVNEQAPSLDRGEVFENLHASRAEWNQAAVLGAEWLDFDITEQTTSTDSNRSLFTLVAGLAVFVLGALLFVISRSILGPLNRLIGEADEITNKRLPLAVAKLRELGADDDVEIKPIARENDDEIGSLVDAFNEVQGTAVRIASDQARSRRNVAEMFVSLGRRNQQLNHRMLKLISDLERDEQDPEVLQGLYRLDHMATRMRRNAESLLVLAGNRSPRQWSQPLPAEDVVRAALSEVENFERVEVGQIPSMQVMGSVAADITHLLAELLDNATNFSDPTTSVQISAYSTVEGLEVEISDEGIGIGEVDLRALNERVSNPPELDKAPSRLLGLFVVGRLAEQHGIDVHLKSQPGAGTVVSVSLPEALFPETVHAEPTPLQPIEINPGVGEEVRADLGFDDEDQAQVAEQTWNPTASHEGQLAEASVPTEEEMQAALAPSFPNVTIDEPALSSPEITTPLSDLPVREIHERALPDTAAPEVSEPEPAPAPAIPPLPSDSVDETNIFDLMPAPAAEIVSPPEAVIAPPAAVTAPVAETPAAVAPAPAPVVPVPAAPVTETALTPPPTPQPAPEPISSAPTQPCLLYTSPSPRDRG